MPPLIMLLCRDKYGQAFPRGCSSLRPRAQYFAIGRSAFRFMPLAMPRAWRRMKRAYDGRDSRCAGDALRRRRHLMGAAFWSMPDDFIDARRQPSHREISIVQAAFFPRLMILPFSRRNCPTLSGAPPCRFCIFVVVYLEQATPRGC